MQVSGSDDFRVYVWGVPDDLDIAKGIEEVTQKNVEHSTKSKSKDKDKENEREEQDSDEADGEESVVFRMLGSKRKKKKINLDKLEKSEAQKDKKKQPYDLNASHDYVLTVNETKEILVGHRSIVNQTRGHPVLPILATSGIRFLVFCFLMFGQVWKRLSTCGVHFLCLKKNLLQPFSIPGSCVRIQITSYHEIQKALHRTRICSTLPRL